MKLKIIFRGSIIYYYHKRKRIFSYHKDDGSYYRFPFSPKQVNVINYFLDFKKNGTGI